MCQSRSRLIAVGGKHTGRPPPPAVSTATGSQPLTSCPSPGASGKQLAPLGHTHTHTHTHTHNNPHNHTHTHTQTHRHTNTYVHVGVCAVVQYCCTYTHTV